jgi:hypothetical protein
MRLASEGGSSLRRKAPKRVTDRREVRAVPGGDNPSGPVLHLLVVVAYFGVFFLGLVVT